jgi:hypothetical protein
MEDNWDTIGILEDYEYSLFLNINGGDMSVNTTSICDVLKAEGYTGSKYNYLFSSMVIFMSQVIMTIQQNNTKK